MRRNASANCTPAARPGVDRALAQEVAEPVAGLDELARVTEQRLDLAFERGADVDPHVGLERAREEQRAHLMGRESLGGELGEVVRIAGRGRDRVERGPAGRCGGRGG